MGALDFNAAVKELAAAVAFLKAEGSPQVGLTGFCMGGALTLAAASKGVEVKCIQPFYGIPPKEHFDVTAITVPVLSPQSTLRVRTCNRSRGRRCPHRP